MTAALRIRRENGIVFVPAPVDAAFRKALLDGVPASLHRKMREALAATLHGGSRAYATHYFGDEANEVFAHAATFAQDLHRFLAQRFGLEGLLDWLTATGFGNDYRMIRVFAEWARLSDEMNKPLIIADAEPCAH